MKIFLSFYLFIFISFTALGQYPFMGKRYFNFFGGSGTEFSIKIDKEGNTKIIFHGTISETIVYEGIFKDTIPIGDFHGLSSSEYILLNKNSASLLGKDMKIIKGCRDEFPDCTEEYYKLE